MTLHLSPGQAGAISTGLPAERNRFIGREPELAVLARLLHTGAHLVSVVGPPGAGKSRLLRHFAWTAASGFNGGVWFCELAAARGFDGMARAVAAGLKQAPAEEAALRQIGLTLAQHGDCLVVLDHFEQLRAQAQAAVAYWLRRAPQARFLVGGHQRLDLAAERALTLGPLAPQEAALLFDHRARAAHSAYAPDAEDCAAIAPLLRQLGRWPAAIEAAAAKVRVLGPRAQLERCFLPQPAQRGWLPA